MNAYDLEDKRHGFVYLAYAENGLYKIGKARNPNTRVRQFTGAVAPFRVTLIHAVFSSRCSEIERLLHMCFNSHREQGEWFSLNDREVRYIKSFDRLEPDDLQEFNDGLYKLSV